MRIRGGIVVAVAALVLAACTPYDFDGDGEADLAYVTETGDWYRVGAPAPFWSGGGPLASHIPAPGDYDGEGLWEPAVVTPTGLWITDGQRGAIDFPPPPIAGPGTEFGVDWLAVPGDYDGDGDTDPAYYRTEDATWHVEGWAGPVPLGVGSDVLGQWYDAPVPGDYDGDGTTDLAVYSVVDGTWTIQGVDDPIDWGPFGWPVAPDLDGDGAADPAVVTYDRQQLVPVGEAPIDAPDGLVWIFGAWAHYLDEPGEQLPLYGPTDQRLVIGGEEVDLALEDGALPTTLQPWITPEIIRMTMVAGCLTTGGALGPDGCVHE